MRAAAERHQDLVDESIARLREDLSLEDSGSARGSVLDEELLKAHSHVPDEHPGFNIPHYENKYFWQSGERSSYGAAHRPDCGRASLDDVD